MNSFSVQLSLPNQYLISLAEIIASKEGVSVCQYTLADRHCFDFASSDDDLSIELIAVLTADPKTRSNVIGPLTTVLEEQRKEDLTQRFRRSAFVQSLVAQ